MTIFKLVGGAILTWPRSNRRLRPTCQKPNGVILEQYRELDEEGQRYITALVHRLIAKRST